MRARNLKPGFFKNEDLAGLPPLTRLLFAGIWSVADREGRLEDRPKQIKAEILPYDDCNVDAMLAELSVASTDDKPFIVRYSVNHRQYIWIPSFLDHQTPHYKEVASKIPPYAGASIIGQSSTDDSASIEPPSANDSGHCCTLNPESGILNPESGILNPSSLGGLENRTVEKLVTWSRKEIPYWIERDESDSGAASDAGCFRALLAVYADTQIREALGQLKTYAGTHAVRDPQAFLVSKLRQMFPPSQRVASTEGQVTEHTEEEWAAIRAEGAKVMREAKRSLAVMPDAGEKAATMGVGIGKDMP